MQNAVAVTILAHNIDVKILAAMRTRASTPASKLGVASKNDRPGISATGNDTEISIFCREWL